MEYIGYLIEHIAGENYEQWLVVFRFDGPMTGKPVELFSFRCSSESEANWLAQTVYKQLAQESI